MKHYTINYSNMGKTDKSDKRQTHDTQRNDNYKIILMLAHSLRRFPSIKTTLGIGPTFLTRNLRDRLLTSEKSRSALNGLKHTSVTFQIRYANGGHFSCDMAKYSTRPMNKVWAFRRTPFSLDKCFIFPYRTQIEQRILWRDQVTHDITAVHCNSNS